LSGSVEGYHTLAFVAAWTCNSDLRYGASDERWRGGHWLA